MKDSLVHHAHKVHLLRVLARCGSVRRAAVEAGVTPSALSQSLSHLENHLGSTLVRRTREGLLLTTEGQALIEALAPYLDGIDAYDEARKTPEAMPPKLVIGSYDSIAITVFPQLLPVLQKKYPRMRLNVVTARSHQLYSAVRSGEMDMAIVIESEDANNLNTTRVAEERLGLYVSSRHAIRSEAPDGVLKNYGLATISPGPQGYPRYYQKFLATFGQLPTVITTDSFETVRHLTLGGSVIGVLPTRVANRAPDDLREIKAPTTGSRKAFDSLHHFSLVSRKNFSASVRNSFLAEIQGSLRR